MPTPPMSPSTTSPVGTGPPSPTASMPERTQSETGPVTSDSSPSCRGAATTVVIWKTTHITPRNSSGPAKELRATRSMRSDQVTRAPRSVVEAATTRSMKAKRAS